MKMMDSFEKHLWTVLVSLTLVWGCAQQIPDDETVGTPSQAIDGLSIGDAVVPMRDGVRLFADVYLPEGDGPFPVILVRVPYGKRSDYIFMPAFGRFWQERGYAFVVQDVRGRFGSEGTFTPFSYGEESFQPGQEVVDAYDTLDWIAAQGWCDGNIGMMGESYYGFTTLAGAWSGHPALKAISPANISVARESRVLDGAYPLQAGGLWTLEMDDIERGEYQDLSDIDLSHLPLIAMGEAHGLRDVLWRGRITDYLKRNVGWRDRVNQFYAQIRVPALHFGGWYDTYTRGTLIIWEGVKTHSTDEKARNSQWLVMGPWDHEHMTIHLSGQDGMTRIGRLEIGDAAVSTYQELLVEFFDHTLRGLDNGFDARPRVQYFTIGDNAWRLAQQWPPEAVQATPMYFHSRGSATTDSSDGRLDFARPGDEPVDTYRYDPRDPVTISAEINVWERGVNMVDRAKVPKRPDVVAYTSAPLEDPLELTGPITVNLYASSTAPDTDFTAALVHVFPDGYSLLIQEGILRASFRDRDALPSPIEPGAVYGFAIDLWATSYVVPPGHRLRVEISSSNFPRLARNLNTGNEFGTSDEIAVADQTIYHSKEYPSHVLLPVMPR
ncbi:MAG: CocE/NonD family hydrolase [Deltaproteobacteria bacterium]|jgi:putative CocE/NonD family hydrolase|nr:CocE/NonD family hydrolase [Deltaproteobacteria bacterium]